MARPKKMETDNVLTTAEKRKMVLKLKRQGMHYEEIAEKVGYSPLYCRTIVGQALKELAAEVRDTAIEIRQLEEERLDSMYNALADKIRAGDIKSIEAALKIMTRRAALRGLDEPAKVQVSWGEHTDQELIQIARERGVPIPAELLVNVQEIVANARPADQVQPGLEP